MLLANWARRLREAGHVVVWRTGTAAEDLPIQVAQLLARHGHDRVSSSTPTAFVFIDDVHVITADAHRDALARLAEDVPDGVRLILGGRYQPFPSTTFLRATGTLLELRAADLAFDRLETERLAIRHRLELPGFALDMLLQRTGGWATGLALAMPWLLASEEPVQAVSRFDGDNRAVADYLVSEIVETLSDEDRTVLMAAAVREIVPLDLAVVLGKRRDTGAVLQRLSRRNTLIVQEEDNSFRYHPILLSFMQAEARRRDIIEAANHHVAAAWWFAGHGDGANALEQALLSRLPGVIADTLERYGLDLVLAGNSSVVGRALDSLRGRPERVSSLVLTLLLDAPYFPDSHRAQHLVTAAQQKIAEHDADDATHARHVIWDRLLTILQGFLADDDRELTEALAGLVGERLAIARRDSLSLDLLAGCAEGWCLSRVDRAHDAVERFRAVAQAAHGAGYDWLFLLATDLAATAAASLGEWLEVNTLEDQLGVIASDTEHPMDRASARALYVTAVRAYQRCDDLPSSVAENIAAADPLGSDLGLLVPAKVLLLLPQLDTESNPRAALGGINQLMWAEADRHPRMLAACCVRMVDLTNRLEGGAKARELAQLVRATLGPDSLESRLLHLILSPPTHARAGVERGLEDAVEHAERAWHLTTIVHSWIALADLAEATDRHTVADWRLTRALEFAERFRLERVFLARDGLGANLISGRIGRFGHLDAYARRIQTCAARLLPSFHGDGPSVGALLTPRERELLRELPMHQTVADIADNLSLSSNTVKTHLRSIYQKLGASDRAEAVLVAHSQGLV
ncbi:MAG TPA: LuxR C-terminal-related transcriptional regulator [Microbacteriaceae bacterium]